ncbi:hypothetical protein PsorP6_004366 [Peronosclerospora sorghi]|uniref:Uncharacterized protein n=1 Tax=Peronosclerospora sorghi TaxID=230839 RepID=A0ACC0VLD9_9STRA|nr:hypothetical protein PsorP6_004366 [Peronosclerospora sorghi]
MTKEPKSDNALVKDIIERMNTQQFRTKSVPNQTILHCTKAAERKEQAEENENSPVDTLSKAVIYKTLTINTQDENDTMTHHSNGIFKSTFYSNALRSPSACSTASTGSIDSRYNSLDICSPELQHPSREISASVSKIVKPVVYRSRPSTPPITLQRMPNAKLTSRDVNQRNVPANKSPLTKEIVSSIPVPRSKRGSSQTPYNKTPPSSSSTPRYMNYDNSARFAATKAWNKERRRLLEERNRNLATKKVQPRTSKSPRKPRTPDYQGCINQMRFDVDSTRRKERLYPHV